MGHGLAAALPWWETAWVAAPPATLQQRIVLQAEESRPRMRQLLGAAVEAIAREELNGHAQAATVAANGSERAEEPPRPRSVERSGGKRPTG